MPELRRRQPPPPSAQADPRAVLFLLLAVAAAVIFFSFQPATGQIPYSEFKQALDEGKVAELRVSVDTISGQLVEGDSRRPFSTTRVEDPGLVELLEAKKVRFTGVTESAWSQILFWAVPFVLILLFWGVMLTRLGRFQGPTAFGRARATIHAEDSVKVSFADVAGVDEAEAELSELVDFLRHPDKYTSLGARIPKGVLLVGPPGTGKTLLARAIAGQAGVPFFSLSGSEFVEMFVGVGAARVRDLFAQAESRAPCIIFIDELDAIGKARGRATLPGAHEEREQTLNQLLAEMDGFDPRKGVIVVSATNRPEILDPALLRAGRFDRRIVVDRPDVKGREAILRIHARAVKSAPDVDFALLAARTPGFVGADLANVVNEAALLAARLNQHHVELRNFEEAIDRVVAGLETRRVIGEQERRMIAVHEAGHAVVASTVRGADPVHKVSIVQRGVGLGFTMQRPKEDRHLQTASQMEGQLTVLLGGRAAELLLVGEPSTGALSDLQRATELARAMVAQFGMSPELGPVSYGPQPVAVPPFMEGGIAGVPHSEQVAVAIDREVRRLVEQAASRAAAMLTQRRVAVERVVECLLEKETLSGDELRVLLEPVIEASPFGQGADPGRHGAPSALPAPTPTSADSTSAPLGPIPVPPETGSRRSASSSASPDPGSGRREVGPSQAPLPSAADEPRAPPSEPVPGDGPEPTSVEPDTTART